MIRQRAVLILAGVITLLVISFNLSSLGDPPLPSPSPTPPPVTAVRPPSLRPLPPPPTLRPAPPALKPLAPLDLDDDLDQQHAVVIQSNPISQQQQQQQQQRLQQQQQQQIVALLEDSELERDAGALESSPSAEIELEHQELIHASQHTSTGDKSHWPPLVDWERSFFPLDKRVSDKTHDARVKFFHHEHWHYIGYGGGYDSPADARYATRASIAIHYTLPSLEQLRRAIGTVHHYAWGRRIVIYATSLTDDMLWEASHFYHCVVLRAKSSVASQIDLSSALHHARHFFGSERCALEHVITNCRPGASIGVVMLPQSFGVVRFLCKFDRMIQESARRAFEDDPTHHASIIQTGWLGLPGHSCDTTAHRYAVCFNAGEFLTSVAESHDAIDREVCYLHLVSLSLSLCLPLCESVSEYSPLCD
jgi:hypothetical protein